MILFGLVRCSTKSTQSKYFLTEDISNTTPAIVSLCLCPSKAREGAIYSDDSSARLLFDILKRDIFASLDGDEINNETPTQTLSSENSAWDSGLWMSRISPSAQPFWRNANVHFSFRIFSFYFSFFSFCFQWLSHKTSVTNPAGIRNERERTFSWVASLSL